MRKISLLIISAFLFLFSSAQTYNANSGSSVGAISPAGTSTNPNYYPLVVSGLSNNGIIDSTYGLFSVTVNITQPYDADLIIRLVAPDGTTILLSNQNGSSGQNYTGTIFTSTALNSISSGTPPYTGTFLPEGGNLGSVNNKQNGNGTWQLMVDDIDSLATNAGKVTSWSLVFNNTPALAPPPRPNCTGNTVALNSCVDAPFVCNLNGFCGSTSANDTAYQWDELKNTFFACKQSSIQNNSFIRFVAGATSASFNVWVFNSRDGDGIQMLFFNDVCGSGNVINYGCSHQIPIQNTPFLITATGLTVGQTYYLMFDGYGGDVCDYTIQAVSGVNVVNIALDPDSVTVCRGSQIKMHGTSGLGNTYAWSSATNPAIANPNVALSDTTLQDVVLNTGALPVGVTTDSVTLTATAVGTCPATATSIFFIQDVPSVTSTATTQSGLVGFSANPLTVSSTTTGISYQWYVSLSKSYSGSPIKDDTTTTITPPTNAVGTFYYYCLVKNGGCATPSQISTVIVNSGPPCAGPDTLSFVQQPTTTPQGSAMSPAVTVKVFCKSNGINYSPNTYSGLVTLVAKDGCGYFSQSVNAVNGLATFSSVIFNRSIQNGVSLVATAAGVPGSVTSDTFSIIAPSGSTTKTVTVPGQWQTIINEDFSDVNPTVWYNGDSTDDRKQNYNYFAQLADPNTTWAAVRTCVGCKESKLGTTETPTYVLFPSITNLANYDSVYFSFTLAAVNTTYDSTTATYFDYMSEDDSTDVQVSTDGGNTWQTVLHETGVGAAKTNGGRKFVGIGDINPADTILKMGSLKSITTADGNSYFNLLVSTLANPAGQFRFKLIWADNDQDKEWALINPKLIGKTKDSTYTVTSGCTQTVTDTIAINNFDAKSTETWGYTIPAVGTVLPDGNTVNAVDNTGVFCNAGNCYIGKTVTSPNKKTEDYNTVTFKPITNLSKYSNLTFSFQVASLTDLGSADPANTNDAGAAGNDNNENMVIETSTDGGATWQTLLTYQGFSNLLFPFSSTSPVNLALGANATYGGTPGGTQPTAQSAFTVSLPAGTSQFQFRFTANNNRYSETWDMDNITLTADTTITIPGCGGTSSPLPTLTVGNDTAICNGGSATLYATLSNAVSPVKYTWTPSTGFNPISDSTLANPTVSPTTNQSYSLTIVDSGNCKATAGPVSVIVNKTPTLLSQTTPAQTVCVGSQLAEFNVVAANTETYQWYQNSTPSNTGGTLIVGAVSPTYTPSANIPGTYYYYCSLSGTCNPPVTSAVSGAIVVQASPSITTVPLTLSSGTASVDLSTAITSSTAGLTLTYYTDSLLTIPASNPVSAAGTYYVKAVSALGCISEAVIIINPYTTPAPAIGSIRTTGTGCTGTDSLIATFSGEVTKITWYDATTGTVVQTDTSNFATVGVTVAGGNGQGAGLNQFYWPYGIALDPSYNMYVSDYQNNRVMLWKKGAVTGTLFAGKPWATGHNQDTGNLYNPTGLFYSATGSLYIADYNNHKVQKYLSGSSTPIKVGGNESTKSGTPAVDGPPNLAYPFGIYVTNDSILYCADAGNSPSPVFGSNTTQGQRVMQWLPGADTGTLVAGSAAGSGTGANQLSYPTGVWLNKNGDIYVADFLNKRIQKWAKGTNTGVTVANLSALGVYPTDVVVDSATGLLYITATNEVIDYQPFFFSGSANYLLKWVEGASSGTIINTGTASGNVLHTPTSLALAPNGSIYVVDRGNNRVQAWFRTIDSVYKPTVAGNYYAVITYASGSVVTTDTVTMNAAVTPSVIITPSVAGSICPGTPVTFSAAPTNGGTAPTYQWLLNGASVGTGSTYTNGTLANGDVVECVITSNANCLAIPTDTSNVIKMVVSNTVTPQITISASATEFCAGTPATFTATPSNAGPTPSYQWKVDGANVGTDSSGFTTSTLKSGDSVVCIMTSSSACLVGAIDTSNTIKVIITGDVSPAISIAASATTICWGASVTFTSSTNNGGTAPTYQWLVNGSVPVGSNSTNSVFTSNTLNNGDKVTCVLTSNYACLTAASATSNAITMTVNPSAIPSLTISATDTTICAGTSVTFTAAPTNGGTVPVYQWQVNGNNVGTNSNKYTSSTLNNNDSVTCILASSLKCVSSPLDTSIAIKMIVDPDLSPSVSIAADTTTICAGTAVTFTATPTNGGTATKYQWQVNGANAGANSSTFTSTTLKNGDAVTCTITSNASCLTANTATSSPLSIIVIPNVTPSVDIAASNNNICSGTSVTFTAIPTNGGTAPIYQWYINNVPVGAPGSSNKFTSTTFNNGDVVKCVLISNLACLTIDSAISNTVTMKVIPNITPSISIAASDTSICTGTNVDFTATATNAGAGITYQWQVNGANVGTNSTKYSSNTLQNGDVVICFISSTAACVVPPVDTSSAIVMSVTARAVPSVIITSDTTTICSGSTVTFVATPSNGGATPTYKWYVNGVLQPGNKTDTFTTGPIKNNVTVSCVMTTSQTCVATNTATSNSIAISVTQSVVPSIVVTSSATNICAGTAVIFTATATNGGTQPSYQWQKNGNPVGTDSVGYIDSTLISGDVITCVLTSNIACVSSPTATSKPIKVLVNPLVTPSVTIVASADSVCQGSPITFKATPTNGGSAPIYEWYDNTVQLASSTSSTYTGNTFVNGDIVTCKIISNSNCLATNTSSISNAILIAILPKAIPTVSITASTTTICVGSPVTFTASQTNGGTAPLYQWKINNVNSGAPTSSNTFTSNTLKNNDVVTCVLTTSLACVTSSNVTSAPISIIVNPIVVPTVSIAANADTICSGTAVTFTASTTNAGLAPSYQWYLNGALVVTTGSNSYTNSSLANGDIISCTLISNASCLATGTANSRPIKVIVITAPVVANITGSSTLCVGDSTMLLDATHGGTWVSYFDSLATISQKGEVVAKEEGVASIGYSLTNSCGTTTQTFSISIGVKPNISPISVSVNVVCKEGTGSPIQLGELVSGGVWSSLEPNIATVDGNGVVTGLEAGKVAYIKYTKTNSCGSSFDTLGIYVSGELPTELKPLVKMPDCIHPLSDSVDFDIVGKEGPYYFKIRDTLYQVPLQQPLSGFSEGIYPVYVYNNNGCLVDALPDFTIAINKSGGCDTLYVPSAFAPNSPTNNGQNRLLKPFGGVLLQSLTFKVYNRYGSLVYESQDIYQGWDGTINGVKQPTGAYVWFLDYTQQDGVHRFSKGTSVLIR